MQIITYKTWQVENPSYNFGSNWSYIHRWKAHFLNFQSMSFNCLSDVFDQEIFGVEVEPQMVFWVFSLQLYRALSTRPTSTRVQHALFATSEKCNVVLTCVSVYVQTGLSVSPVYIYTQKAFPYILYFFINILNINYILLLEKKQ